jgi:hypothetical protein
VVQVRSNGKLARAYNRAVLDPSAGTAPIPRRSLEGRARNGPLARWALPLRAAPAETREVAKGCQGSVAAGTA